MVRRGQVLDEDVQELDTVLAGIEDVLEDGENTVEDQGRGDAVGLHLVTVVDEVLHDRDKDRRLVVCALRLGLLLPSRVLERRIR